MPRRPAPIRPLRSALAAFLALGLAGCAVGPDYRTPEIAVPAQWGSAGAETPPAAPQLSEWWQRLDDPLLTQLLGEAVADNLDVATAKAQIREARASYRQAGGARYPSLDGSASATRGGTADSSNASGQYQAGFDASWELDLFGANRRAVEAAKYGLDAAEEELRATLLTLVGDIASNYVEARGFQARIAYARQTAEAQRETETLTRIKFEAGAASAVDVANAAGQASSTEAAIPTLETAYAEAVHRLGVLTGRAPAALKERLADVRPIPTPPLPIATGVPADLLLARPDVRLAERQLAQSTALIGQAEAARYPSISLGGSLSTSAATLGDIAGGTSISWLVGPTLTVPIFNAGQLESAVEVTEAQRDQSFIAFRAAVLTALEDVENAAVSLTQERLRYDALRESAAAFGEALRLARALYQTGATDFLDVLDAERSLYSAQDALIQSETAITTDYIALNKALGGGWDGAIDSSRPEVVDVNTGPHFPQSQYPSQ
ncbi:efflux transporter outer membrane subunit [Pelagibius sp. 7325]|uniref:efflux transporter outer membrane subunit n=1 Tax=Pelagibius sp. 7325 TaxID=3131994 RepID=UPI0030EBB468